MFIEYTSPEWGSNSHKLVVIGTDCIHYYIFYNVIITNKWILLWIRKKRWILAFLILLTKVYAVLFSICLSYPCLYGSWVYILYNGRLLSLLLVSLIPYFIKLYVIKFIRDLWQGLMVSPAYLVFLSPCDQWNIVESVIIEL